VNAGGATVVTDMYWSMYRSRNGAERTTFGIGWRDPEALVKDCFQNITLTNILVRLENEKFMKNEMAITHLIFDISKRE
jgi:hypothetical protein